MWMERQTAERQALELFSSLQKESEWKNHSVLGFPALNNEAKYEALLARLKMSRQVGVDKV